MTERDEFVRIRDKIRASLAAKVAERSVSTVTPAPRYDDVYFEGVAWLDKLASGEEEDLVCGACGGKDIYTKIEAEQFDYGLGDNVVTLSAVVPVHSCLSCAFVFTDHVGEEIRDRTVRQYLIDSEAKK